jgi:hypothetical protein
VAEADSVGVTLSEAVELCDAAVREAAAALLGVGEAEAVR